jgi:hypothetical protein
MRRPSRYTQSRRLKREEPRASDLSFPDSTEREFNKDLDAVNKDFTKDVAKGNTPDPGRFREVFAPLKRITQPALAGLR